MTKTFRNDEAARRSGEAITFSFGENWLKYIDDLSEAQIVQAQDSLLDNLGGSSIDGRTVIDLGCGSGVFSLGFYSLGASRLTSVDIDPNSIACTEQLRLRTPDRERWTVLRGSVLDDQFVGRLEPADIVYSWGVLHHTGAMWNAIENAMKLVRPGGLLSLALYTRPNHLGLHMRLKRTYNRSPRTLRPVITALYAGAFLANKLRQGRNPVSYVREYGESSRGMSFWRDADDWLGGLPFEFASADEVQAFAASRDFSVERVVERSGGGNNDYLLRRNA